MDYTTGNMFSNGDGKHLNDDVNVLSEYYDGKVKKTASQIILEKYGVNKVFGQKPLDEVVVPWDLRGHVGFIVTRLSRRFGILKYLCYRQSMERRMSWQWVRDGYQVPQHRANGLKVKILDPMFFGYETWVDLYVNGLMRTKEDLCIRALATICATWALTGELEPQKHDGDIDYWESLLLLEIDIASVHDEKILEVEEAVAILWNQIGLLKVDIQKVQDNSSPNYVAVDSMLERFESNPWNDGLSDHLTKLQIHLEKLQKIFAPKSRVANIVTKELSYVEICQKRKESAKEYVTNVLSARTKDDGFLIIDCNFSAQKLTDVSVAIVALNEYEDYSAQYKLVGVKGSKKNRKFLRFECTSETLVQKLRGYEKVCKGILFFDSRLDLKILAKVGFVPILPVYDVQKMVPIFDIRDPQLQGEPLSLISALRQLLGSDYVSQGTDSQMIGRLFHLCVRCFCRNFATGCEGPYVMEEWLKVNPTKVPSVIYL